MNGQNEISIIQSFYGTDPLRVSATEKALSNLLKMAVPFSKFDWVFVEGQLDESRAKFKWLSNHGITYVFVKMTLEQFDVMYKPELWNIGQTHAKFDKYCFLDSDVYFSNEDWLDQIHIGFDKYDVFSPQGYSCDENRKKYFMMKSIGMKFLTENTTECGHPGYGICLTKNVFDKLNGFQITLILSDIWNYVRILGKDMMKPFSRWFSQNIVSIDIPIKFGSTNNILHHCWHGERNASKFTKMKETV